VNGERKSSEIPQTIAISWFVAARYPGWPIGAIGFTRSYRWAIGFTRSPVKRTRFNHRTQRDFRLFRTYCANFSGKCQRSNARISKFIKFLLTG